jgi:CBS domain-containing protein
MNVKDVMVKNVSVCRPDNNLAEVAATMWDARCGVLPVVDCRGVVIGMITDRDICIALGTRNIRASEVMVKDVSLPSVFSCRANDDVRRALNTMTSQDVRRLPVVDDDGKLVGIVSIDDLFMHSERQSGKLEISYEDVVDAAKSILNDRSPGHAHEPAELVALAHTSARG